MFGMVCMKKLQLVLHNFVSCNLGGACDLPHLKQLIKGH